MEKIRNWLLKNREIELYETILGFMREPDHYDIEDIISVVPIDITEDVHSFLSQIMHDFAKDRDQYHKKYTYGQTIIWETVLLTYKKLILQQSKIQAITLSERYNSYFKAVNDLKKLLTAYANMQDELSELEETLGVDRFLDRVSEDTFAVLTNIVRESKNVIECKTRNIKESFQMHWNTTNVFHVIGHSLIRRNDGNPICDSFSSECEQSLLFIIDGFGYCQYLWNNGIGSKDEYFTFNENIFKWLSDNSLSREMILGSSFVTDTGAGLAQLFLGQNSKETGVFASKLKDRESKYNFFETKRIGEQEYNNFFSCNNSITDIVTTFGQESRIYYCSRYQEPPSGFSKCLYKSAEVNQILPPERAFSIILDDFNNGMNKGLQIVYMTGIDNSGHTVGAYSSYERQEHKKIDGLIKNFIIELAFQNPELFDGKRNIYITADHGMYESSKIMINRKEILDSLFMAGIKKIKLVENNRAMLVYNEGTEQTDDIKKALIDYFASKKIDVDVQGIGDKGYDACINGNKHENIKPDIVARFVGEGLFYSNPHINNHLLHLGGHGGNSVDEVFVPMIEIPLSNELLEKIRDRFLSKK